jgi:hypothetical protein
MAHPAAAASAELPVAAGAPPQLASPDATVSAHALAAAPVTIAPIPPPPTQGATLLAQFLQQPLVRQRLHDAGGAYLDACKALKVARSALDKFKAACNRTPGVVTLPRSLQLRLVEHSRLPAVDGQPAFFADCTAALQAVERTATADAYKALLGAKEKHLAHLASVASVPAFLAHAVAAHRTFVADYARDVDAAWGGNSGFSVDAAVTDFETQLQTHVNDLFLSNLNDAQQQRAQDQLAAAADRTAQEQVLAGAHTGATIASLARREVAKGIAPLKLKVDQIKRTQNQQPRSSPHDSAHDGPASHRPARQREPARAHPKGRADKSMQEQRRAHDRKHHAHAAFQPRDATERARPPFTAAAASSSASPPLRKPRPHTESTEDRQRPHSPDPPSRHTAGGARKHRREETTLSSPKNGAGGDRSNQRRQQRPSRRQRHPASEPATTLTAKAAHGNANERR